MEGCGSDGGRGRGVFFARAFVCSDIYPGGGLGAGEPDGGAVVVEVRAPALLVTLALRNTRA